MTLTRSSRRRGEFLGHPTGHPELSQRRRASHTWQRARRKRPEVVASDTGSNRFSQTGGLSQAGGQGKLSTGARRICRSFVCVFLWSVVASTPGCQRRLGADPILAIVG